jgi:hypothetical protein
MPLLVYSASAAPNCSSSLVRRKNDCAQVSGTPSLVLLAHSPRRLPLPGPQPPPATNRYIGGINNSALENSSENNTTATITRLGCDWDKTLQAQGDTLRLEQWTQNERAGGGGNIPTRSGRLPRMCTRACALPPRAACAARAAQNEVRLWLCAVVVGGGGGSRCADCMCLLPAGLPSAGLTQHWHAVLANAKGGGAEGAAETERLKEQDLLGEVMKVVQRLLDESGQLLSEAVRGTVLPANHGILNRALKWVLATYVTESDGAVLEAEAVKLAMKGLRRRRSAGRKAAAAATDGGGSPGGGGAAGAGAGKDEDEDDDAEDDASYSSEDDACDDEDAWTPEFIAAMMQRVQEDTPGAVASRTRASYSMSGRSDDEGAEAGGGEPGSKRKRTSD